MSQTSDGPPAADLVDRLLGRIKLEIFRVAKAHLSEMIEGSSSHPAYVAKMAAQKELGIGPELMNELFDPAADATVRLYFGSSCGSATDTIKALSGNQSQLVPWRKVIDDTIARYEQYA